VTAPVWYRVRNLAEATRFYVDTLGFRVTYHDDDGTWSRLRHGEMEIALAEGEPIEDGGVASVEVPDVKAEADRLRAAGVDVGVVLELHGQIRLVDVLDPDGNRIQLAEDVDDEGAPTA
jgi:catechol 2,3-dioxygenase-like lactoylglutathione lyase family enzyme